MKAVIVFWALALCLELVAPVPFSNENTPECDNHNQSGVSGEQVPQPSLHSENGSHNILPEVNRVHQLPFNQEAVWQNKKQSETNSEQILKNHEDPQRLLLNSQINTPNQQHQKFETTVPISQHQDLKLYSDHFQNVEPLDNNWQQRMKNNEKLLLKPQHQQNYENLVITNKQNQWQNNEHLNQVNPRQYHNNPNVPHPVQISTESAKPNILVNEKIVENVKRDHRIDQNVQGYHQNILAENSANTIIHPKNPEVFSAKGAENTLGHQAHPGMLNVAPTRANVPLPLAVNHEETYSTYNTVAVAIARAEYAAAAAVNAAAGAEKAARIAAAASAEAAIAADIANTAAADAKAAVVTVTLACNSPSVHSLQQQSHSNAAVGLPPTAPGSHVPVVLPKSANTAVIPDHPVPTIKLHEQLQSSLHIPAVIASTSVPITTESRIPLASHATATSKTVDFVPSLATHEITSSSAYTSATAATASKIIQNSETHADASKHNSHDVQDFTASEKMIVLPEHHTSTHATANVLSVPSSSESSDVNPKSKGTTNTGASSSSEATTSKSSEKQTSVSTIPHIPSDDLTSAATSSKSSVSYPNSVSTASHNLSKESNNKPSAGKATSTTDSTHATSLATSSLSSDASSSAATASTSSVSHPDSVSTESHNLSKDSNNKPSAGKATSSTDSTHATSLATSSPSSDTKSSAATASTSLVSDSVSNSTEPTSSKISIANVSTGSGKEFLANIISAAVAAFLAAAKKSSHTGSPTTFEAVFPVESESTASSASASATASQNSETTSVPNPIGSSHVPYNNPLIMIDGEIISKDDDEVVILVN